MAVNPLKNIPMTAEVLAAIEGGKKIKAIKLLRESAGIGLKEAKDVIDDYMANNPAAKEIFNANNDAGGLSQESVFKLSIVVIGLVAVCWILWG